MQMHRNGFYAAMKTDESVQAVYIDEGMFREAMARTEARKKAARQKARRKKADAAANREKRQTMQMLGRELKALAAAAVVYWGLTAGLVHLAFAVPVLIAAQTVVCFRAGSWYGRRQSKAK